MTMFNILKTFPFSRDGVTVETAVAGGDCDIPDALAPGLRREGFLRAPGATGAPENKVIEAAPETGGAVLLTDREINADLEGVGVEFDPRDSAEVRMAQRDQARADDAHADVADEATAPVDIPDGWQKLHWKTKVKLAVALGADDVTADEANAVIEAALAKRVA